MWSGAWNKRKLPSEISNRFLASSVGRAGDWWSGGCEFKPYWGQFLTKFILCCVTSDLSDNLTEMRQTGLLWKTRMYITLESLFNGMREVVKLGRMWWCPLLVKMTKSHSLSHIASTTGCTTELISLKRSTCFTFAVQGSLAIPRISM